MLSKTEVFGRLYYCGFEVDEVVPMGHIEYVFAHRKMQPYPQEQIKIYGPLIKLPRICKNGEIRFFYKFRTMHPYAEYIQDVVFDEQGGMNIADKANGDWRISSWGRFMRKYWLDELPMLINWLKGDVKLVGVRPLSQAMYNKYPKDLQEKRIKARPGLIPPFYIDHPKTFDELFAIVGQQPDAFLSVGMATTFFTDALNNAGVEFSDIDSFTTGNAAAMADGKLVYLAGKYSSSVGPIFAAVLNAVNGNPVRDDEGNALSISQNYLVATDSETFDAILNGDKGDSPIFSKDVLDTVIGEVSYEDFVALVESK